MEADGLLDGLVRELQLTEAPEERFPLTIAFMRLLKHLCNFPLPLTLGAGTRQTTGVGPFVEHVMNILLRLDSFSFKDQSEKWQIGIETLAIINAMLNHYVPHSDDFAPSAQAVHPGFQIYRFLLTDSPLLRKLLQIVEVAVDHMEQFPIEHDTTMLLAGEGALELLAKECCQKINIFLC